MKTRVCRLYGKQDLRIETDDVAAPGKGEVLLGVSTAGICGSDLHYMSDGGIGTIRVREPIILGHEASGRVLSLGEGVTGLAEGDAVAINPSRPCGKCEYCAEGLPIHCTDMLFRGSAMRLPHVQGLFRDRIVVEATQCIKLPETANIGHVACAEPLAVCLHAGKMAGELQGKHVLVTGAGPIGNLCAAVAASAGAKEVVVTDLHDATLAVAEKMGATRTINVATDGAALEAYAEGKGYFDTAFECSAAAPAIKGAIMALRPRGTMVQVGVIGDTPMPINAIVAKEVRVQGTHRFDAEFAEAVTAITSGRIDVAPIITKRCPMEDAAAAFKAAADRSRSVKVHLEFETA